MKWETPLLQRGCQRHVCRQELTSRQGRLALKVCVRPNLEKLQWLAEGLGLEDDIFHHQRRMEPTTDDFSAAIGMKMMYGVRDRREGRL